MMRRFRVEQRWLRQPLVVLQVQVPSSYTDPRSCETDHFRVWRDARPEDLMNGELDSDHREP